MTAPYTGNTSGTDSAGILSALNDMAAALAPAARTSSVYRLLASLATTNAASVKATPGTLYAITLYNASASARYLKLYNKASAPTVGTDTPVLTFQIPPGGSWFLDRPSGIYFAAGIGIAITGAAADNDTTAISAGDITCLNVEYV